MDQRAKGGPSLPPPSTLPLLPPAPPQQYPEKEVGSGKRKRREKEGGGGAVLEVLIEGCCGAAGQRQLPFPGRERTCTEGNVRLRIGVQTAKRTKKPPKTLEGYECKPTIRTYQRPGRVETGRGGQEGGGSGQENSPQEEGDGEQNQGSDPNTTQTRKIHSSSPSSSSSSSSSSTAPTSTTPANPQTAPAKQQVPVKLAHKLDTPPEKPRHPDPPDAHIKLPSPAQMDQATSSDPTASSPHYTPPSSPHSPLVKDPSGEAGVKGEGGMLNRGVPTVICRPTRLTKVKARKHNCSSSATPTNVNSTTRPPASSPHQTDLASQDRTTGFSCLPTPPPSTPLLPDQRGAPVADGRLSPNASLTSLSRGPLVQSSVGNERGREEKAKKKKEKDDKARGEKGKGKRGEKERGKEDRGRNESPKMDRDENARDEREREGTGMDERGRYMTGKKERKGEEDKESEKPGVLRMNKWPSSTRCQMLSEVPSRKPSTPSPDPDLTSETGESDYPGGPSRPTVSPSNPSTASPSSPLTSLLPPSLSRHSSSPPTSPREQDSRPLKKRKTRRPSWTRLVNRAQRLAENPDSPQDAPLVALLTTTTPQTPPTTPQTPPSTPQALPTINSPYLWSAESCLAPSVPPPPSPSSLFPSTATAVRPRQAGRPASPTQTHLLTSDPSPSPGPDRSVSQTRKRGRPKSQTSSWNEPPPRHSPKPTRAEVLPHGHDETSDPHVLNPVLDHSPTLTNPSSSDPMPRKRGRPKRLPPSPLLPKHTLQDPNRGTLTPSGGEEGGKDFPSEKGNRQLRMRSIIGEMKMRKRRRLLREMLSGCGVGEEGRGGEGGRDNSRGGAGGVCGSPTAPSLSSSFGGNLVPQINVSKRGTIYMGKRRGRKPKAPANSNPASQSTLFTSLSGPSLFSSPQSQPHPPLSHPFPSPSLTHSSGAQSPYSDGGFTEPAPSLFLPHTFSLPSPSSSCASPRPLSSSFSSSSSLSPSLKRTSPGQGRHPLFHHPSSRLSSPPFTHPPHPLHPNMSVSPTHLKEATPSPISASHSKEVLPSDRVIGLDHNSISERGERRGQGRGGVTMGITSEFTRSVFRTGLGVSLKGQRQLSPSMLLEHPSSVPSLFRVSASPPSASPRHTLPPSDSVEPRDRHRYRRRGCPYTCPPWPCLGHNQRSHLELCPCLAHNTLKRQKHKRKRKYQHLLMHVHDPDFLSELDDLIGQFSKVRIGRHHDWARAGLGKDLDESVGKRRHSSSLSSHNFHSNVYRINLSGYYSPHPLSYPPHPSLTPLHPCHGLPYGSRNPERMLRCGCPTKPCESLDQGEYDQGRKCPLQGNTGHLHPSSLSSPLSSSTTSSSTSMPLSFGYYRGFPLTMAHYPNPHLHPSFPLPPPHPYAPHLHPPHLLLNPARFHRRRSRQLREAGLGGGGGEDVRGRGRGDGERARVRSCPAGSIPGLSCVCGGSEHKLRHKHRHRQPNHDGKEEEEERVAGSQPRSEFTTGEGGSRKTGGQGSAGLRESPWQHRHGKYPSSFSSASPKPASSSSSSSERLKHTPLTCLGSSHLSSFGECWGGRQNPWLRRGGHGAGFRPPDPTWVTLTEGQRTATVGWSEREAGESHTPCHSTFAPSTHTNLFTSSATSGRGMRSGRDNWRPGSQDGSLRSEEPSQTERRGTGPHYDLSRRQLKWLRTGQRFGAKRGPGRPRKNPLASPLVSPTTPPNPPTEKHVQNRDRNRGSRGGGDTVQEVIEAVIQRQRRRRRKRRRIEEEEKEEGERLPCLQSSGEGEPVTHTPSICTGQSELSQTPSLTPASQSDKGADRLPRKRFQRAGLYSDDYKTTDPSSQSQLNGERLEYTPGEQDYSLLPAPIHVGKYLRMRRIDFQLPFDVLWLFKHNQLHKELDVPLSREISSCQPNEKSLSSHQTGVSVPPSPQEECSSPSKKLFLHLDMEPMTTSDRVFVLKHHVFLLRNWEWVRDRQIRLRREREGERDKEGGKDGGGVSSDVATGDNNNNIMSGRPVVVKKKVVLTSEPLSDPQCPPNPLSTTTHLTQPQNTREEKKQWEEEGRRKVRKERLNNILLKLQQA